MTTFSNIHHHSLASFNTASGMRSHVTLNAKKDDANHVLFQYRKRYEITCDREGDDFFIYRDAVSIPQAV